jgi:hypothetical protein
MPLEGHGAKFVVGDLVLDKINRSYCINACKPKTIDPIPNIVIIESTICLVKRVALQLLQEPSGVSVTAQELNQMISIFHAT